jgi:hypothetical protein
MEAILDSFQDLRVTSQDGQDLRICLLKQSNAFSQALRPFCKTRAMMGGAEEHDPTSAVEDLLKMPFWSLLRGR